MTPASPPPPVQFVAPSPVERSRFVAHSAHEEPVYDLTYYLKGGLAGGLCCSATHGGVVPVDVVKTRMQLDPAAYSGMVDGFKKVRAWRNAAWPACSLSL